LDGAIWDLLINGKVAVNGGRPQVNLGGVDGTSYLYLVPGTYSVALVPTSKGIDQAFFGPLDVPVVAGHRYTVVVLGQADEKRHKPLVIDETEAYQKAGVSPSTMGHILINNIKGATGLSYLRDGAGEKDVPYGQFAASALPAGPVKDFEIRVGSEAIESNGAALNLPGVDALDCYGGTYPGAQDANHAPSVSTLPIPDYLQLQSSFSAKYGGKTWAYTTFLAALKTAGLTDMLTTGGPYLLLAPRDEAFAALPKDKLDALLADPKALADLLRGHIVEGFFPRGTMSSAPGVIGYNRTVTNLRGEQLTLEGNDEGLSINGLMTGPTQGMFVANGTRIMSVGKLLLSTAK
jgi:Fasciclin domain